MKNCIIIHGCPSDEEKALNPETRTYDKHWIPWTKQELVEAGIPTETPLMPNPWAPNYQSFKDEFEKQNISEQTILVGHSCGCAFLVRWLGETKLKINKLILVAPWKIPDENDEARKQFYVYDIDDGIKDRVDEIIMFTSDDEEDDGKRSLEVYHKSLDGKIINLQNHGHYTQGDMGTQEFPELIAAITN
jgi:predicted alpha/beta hydrolase family esterase